MCRWAYVLLAFGVAAAVVLFLLPRHEPVYEGKSLSDWVIAMHRGKAPDREKARAVVHQLGTNSFPLLLQWLQRPDHPSFKARVAQTELRVVGWLEARKLLAFRPHPMLMDWKSSYRFLAVEVFNELGPDGKPAIPGLLQLLAVRGGATNDVSDTAGFAYVVLRKMAPASTPALIEAVSSPDSQVWSLAAEALADIGPDAEAALPRLRPRLKDPDPMLRLDAAEAMGKLGANPSEFMPVVIETLRQRDLDSLGEKLGVLLQYKAQAQSAVPLLQQLLAQLSSSDTPDNRGARYLLTNALAQLRSPP